MAFPNDNISDLKIPHDNRVEFKIKETRFEIIRIGGMWDRFERGEAFNSYIQVVKELVEIN